MGEKICEVCTFDKELLHPTLGNLRRFAHICEARFGERDCSFYVQALNEALPRPEVDDDG